MRGWVASSKEADRRRAGNLVGGENVILFNTAMARGEIADGRLGTLILTPGRLFFSAPATRGYEPSPGLPGRQISIILTDIREATAQGHDAFQGIAHGPLAGAPVLLVRTSDERATAFMSSGPASGHRPSTPCAMRRCAIVSTDEAAAPRL